MFDLLQPGDIEIRAGNAVRSSLLIPKTDRMRKNPTIRTILMPQSVLQLKMRLLPIHIGEKGAQGPLAIVRMYPRLPFIAPIGHLGVIMPKHLFESRGKIHVLLSDIPVPNPRLGPLNAQRQSLLTFPQRLFSMFARRDIDPGPDELLRVVMRIACTDG